ncbi:MAG: methionyl-tRNA formyltransferase [Chloroflexi bacterium]|nr:methionyl-tRNA formyltransferase [Chloroflexota bacterium]
MAKIVFMGTPDFALPSLHALIRDHHVAAVVTQPDRRAGRRRELRESPVKRLARAADIAVLQPQSMRDRAAIDELRSIDAEVFVVAAYGQILPQSVLDLPKRGVLNVHASLLPRWRGAAPIQAAIKAGDSESGVTIMLLDAGLDTGPLLSKRALSLAADETGKSLHDKLAALGAELLVDTLPRYLGGEIEPQAQDESAATYAPQIKKEDGLIDWNCSAATIERLVRAFRPWPGTFTKWRGRQLKIMAGFVGQGAADAGRVVERDGAFAIGAGDGLYFPTELQLEGKRKLSAAAFINGYGDFVGSTLGC